MTDNSNAEPELLSCPFCGGKANAGWFAITHNIGCDECGYSLDACKSDIGLSYEDSFTPEVEAAIAKFNVTRWNTRADLTLAQVAVAYEDAANEARSFGGDCVSQWHIGYSAACGDIDKAIRALTPDDAKAALDALLKAERAKAYERAAVEISDYQAFTKYAQEPLTNEMCAAIRALAQEDGE